MSGQGLISMLYLSVENTQCIPPYLTLCHEGKNDVNLGNHASLQWVVLEVSWMGRVHWSRGLEKHWSHTTQILLSRLGWQRIWSWCNSGHEAKMKDSINWRRNLALGIKYIEAHFPFAGQIDFFWNQNMWRPYIIFNLLRICNQFPKGSTHPHSLVPRFFCLHLVIYDILLLQATPCKFAHCLFLDGGNRVNISCVLNFKH